MAKNLKGTRNLERTNCTSRVLCSLMLMVTGMYSSAFAADHTTSGAKPKAKSAGKPAVTRLHIDVPCRAWVPKTMPKTVLLCVHGLGLNSASYENFGRRMSGLGIATYAVDVRGFGTWMKLEGKEQVDFNACIDDVAQALKVLHTAYPHLPIFVLGESMGGAIALRVTAVHPELVDGLISAVPSGDRFHKTKNELRVALRLVTGGSKKPMDVGTRTIEDATDDPAVREQWKDDPLNRLNLTPKELIQFQKFMNENHETAKQIDKKPVLFLAGFKDKLVKPQGTIELFNEMSSEDKMLVVVGDGEHLIFEQSQLTDEVCWVLMGWLKSHVEHLHPAVAAGAKH
jgi:acylglycerol lipase